MAQEAKKEEELSLEEQRNHLKRKIALKIKKSEKLLTEVEEMQEVLKEVEDKLSLVRLFEQLVEEVDGQKRRILFAVDDSTESGKKIGNFISYKLGLNFGGSTDKVDLKTIEDPEIKEVLQKYVLCA